MNEKFTPAPWFVYGSGVKSRATEEIVAFANLDPNDATEGYANAALIAAAPEMYAMLQKILEVYEMDTDDTNSVLRLLAHARGEV